MITLIPAEKGALIDEQAEQRYGVSVPLLMESAGIHLWQKAASLISPCKKDEILVFLAGKGNNGGDALVMARHAVSQGFTGIKIILTGEAPSKLNSLHIGICEKWQIPVFNWQKQDQECVSLLRNAKVIFDGLCGTGIKLPLRELHKEIIDFTDKSNAKKIAIDIPSGIAKGFDKDSRAFSADHTLKVAFAAEELYLPLCARYCGEIHLVSIGFHPELLKSKGAKGSLLQWPNDFLLPEIPAFAYKKDRGHLGVFAGASGTCGAAILSARAAARSRCGLVSVHIEAALINLVNPVDSALMIKPWNQDELSQAESIACSYDALLVGPGWGQDRPQEWLKALLKGKCGVLDADALRLLALMNLPLDLKGKWVLTPHPGELSALTGRDTDSILSDPVGIAGKLASELNAVVVLKAQNCYILSPDQSYSVVQGRNSAMATAGSGDILAGIIAGFMATGVSPLNAAMAGCLLHQGAGEAARIRVGWFVADDLLPFISSRVCAAEKGFDQETIFQVSEDRSRKTERKW